MARFRRLWHHGRNQFIVPMNTLPIPALIAATTAVIALPFSLPAAGTLLVTAALGAIIHADYVQRRTRIRLPRRSTRPQACNTCSPHRGESHPLAA
jgi:hypothetical protein